MPNQASKHVRQAQEAKKKEKAAQKPPPPKPELVQPAPAVVNVVPGPGNSAA